MSMACVTCTSPSALHSPSSPFVIHSVAFNLFVSSHICLVSFSRPQSNRFFLEAEPVCGLPWGGGTGRGGRPENCISLCISTPCPRVIDSAPTKTAHTHVGWRNTHAFVWRRTLARRRSTHVRIALDPSSSTNKKLFAFWLVLRLFILHRFLSPTSHIRAHTDMIHARTHAHVHMPLHSDS